MRFRLLIAFLFLWLAAAGHTAAAAAGPEPVPEIMPGILQGYLAREDLPDSLALLPPPPAPGSAIQDADDVSSRYLLGLQDTPRFQLAALDNDLSFPAAAGTFSCALQMPVSNTDTPYLYQLLRRSLTDAGLATYPAKNHYDRARPFELNRNANCATEHEQQMLRGDPSYPSGHTAIGWAWALILTSLAQDRADEILARGKAYGDSRMVCNVHWPSDVAAGRMVGAAVVAVLHANAEFQQDFARAQAEVTAMRARGLPADRDCAAEAAALGIDLYPKPAPN